MHIEWQKMRKSNWKNGFLTFYLCRLTRAVYLFLHRYAIWLFGDCFLAWVQCFYVLGFIQVLACFISLIWGISWTNGIFWHLTFARHIKEFSWCSLSKMGLIWSDQRLKGAWKSQQNTNLMSPNGELFVPTIAKCGLEARAISWNLWCLYSVSQKGRLYVSAIQITSDQFKFVKKEPGDFIFSSHTYSIKSDKRE